MRKLDLTKEETTKALCPSTIFLHLRLVYVEYLMHSSYIQFWTSNCGEIIKRMYVPCVVWCSRFVTSNLMFANTHTHNHKIRYYIYVHSHANGFFLFKLPDSKYLSSRNDKSFCGDENANCKFTACCRMRGQFQFFLNNRPGEELDSPSVLSLNSCYRIFIYENPILVFILYK